MTWWRGAISMASTMRPNTSSSRCSRRQWASENARAIGDMNFNVMGGNNALTQAALARAQPYMQ